MKLAPIVLYETLGPTLPAGAAAAAAIWGLAQRVAMTYPESVRRAGLEGEVLRSLADTEIPTDDEFSFVLAAGERRSDSANVLFRDPSWRKAGLGTLRLNPDDAARLGLAAGMTARVTTRRGTVVAPVEVTDMMRPGHASLPNGQGASYPDENGQSQIHGAATNELTSTDERDWLAGTPWHKHVRARIELAAAGSVVVQDS